MRMNMADRYKELAEVLEQECIAPDIYSMWLQTEQIAEAGSTGTVRFRVQQRRQQTSAASDQSL